MQDVLDVKFVSWGGAEASGDPALAWLGEPAFLTINQNPFNPLGLGHQPTRALGDQLRPHTL